MSNDNSAASFGIGLVVGAAVGLALGFLYAPRTGKETRAMIREKSGETWRKAEEIIKEAQERAKRILDDARSKAAQIKERA
jgi:gas vesicle protein